MRARLHDLSRGLDGGYLLTVSTREDIRGLFEALREKDLDIDLKKHREKRSLDANAYFWSLCNLLSAKLRIPPNDVYRNYIRDIGGNFEIVPVKEERIEDWRRIWCRGHSGRIVDDLGPCRTIKGYHNTRCYIGSSDYDTAQMSRLIDMIVEDCREQGIETMTERELSLLKEGWGK